MKRIRYRSIIVCAAAFSVFPSLCSCVPLLVGAAVGYVAHDEGFMRAPPHEEDYGAQESAEEAYEEPVY